MGVSRSWQVSRVQEAGLACLGSWKPVRVWEAQPSPGSEVSLELPSPPEQTPGSKSLGISLKTVSSEGLISTFSAFEGRGCHSAHS